MERIPRGASGLSGDSQGRNYCRWGYLCAGLSLRLLSLTWPTGASADFPLLWGTLGVARRDYWLGRTRARGLYPFSSFGYGQIAGGRCIRTLPPTTQDR